MGQHRDFLAITDFSTDELLALLDRAARLKSGKDKSKLSGKSLAMIFRKSSTRTRVSFEVAMTQLGGHAIFLSDRDSQIGRGETVADTAGVLSRYLDGITIRTFAHAEVEELAEHATVPVVNALTDLLHPCQVIADLQTVAEAFGSDFPKRRVAWIGDGNNMANSWINGAYRRRWAFSGGGSDDLRGTLRAYVAVPLPGFARWVVAGRIAGAVSGGRYARNFAMGGEPGGNFEIVPGLGFGAGEREFAMRGYPRDASRFTRVVVGAAEVRIPLFLIGRAVGKLPLAVDKVSLSLFGETGVGWRAEAGSRRLDQYRDIGAELVVDVGLNLDAPFRFRFGAARALTSGLGANRGDWRAYVALGSAF